MPDMRDDELNGKMIVTHDGRDLGEVQQGLVKLLERGPGERPYPAQGLGQGDAERILIGARIGERADYASFPWLSWDLAIGRATDDYLAAHVKGARVVMRVSRKK